MSDTPTLVTTKSDADKAKSYRDQIRPLLEQACEIITAARRDGLVIGFALAPDQGRTQRVGNIDISKPL